MEMTYNHREFCELLANLDGPDHDYFFQDPMFWDILDILQEDMVVSGRWEALYSKYDYE